MTEKPDAENLTWQPIDEIRQKYGLREDRGVGTYSRDMAKNRPTYAQLAEEYNVSYSVIELIIREMYE